MAQSQLVIICLVFASAFGIQKRGVVEEVGNIFESFTNGFTNSFDQIHKAAREEVSRLQVSLIDIKNIQLKNEISIDITHTVRKSRNMNRAK